MGMCFVLWLWQTWLKRGYRAMVWGSTLVTQQAMDWNITVNHSATSMNYGILLQGFGGIFAVPLIEAYGR